MAVGNGAGVGMPRGGVVGTMIGVTGGCSATIANVVVSPFIGVQDVARAHRVATSEAS